MNQIRGTLALFSAAVLVTAGLSGCGDNAATIPLQAVSERASPSVDNLIAYAAFGGTGQLFVFSIRPDGSGNVLLTRLDADGDIRNDGGFHPSWRPDGDAIVFGRTDAGNRDIFRMDDRGGDVTQLTTDPNSDMQPCYSADGSKIAFVSNRFGTNDIFIMDADGSNQTQITSSPADDQWPCFDPTGQFIAYQSTAEEDDQVEDTDIWRVDLNTGVQTDLTDESPDSSNQGAPSWSPDGAKMLYHDDRAGDFDIWVMDSNGANQQQLERIAEPLSEGFPAWFADGNRFAFVRARAVWTAASDGTDVRQVTRSAASP